MSERFGRILVDRSPALNIPQEKIYELGNWQSIATVQDVPEITWDLLFPWQERYYWYEAEAIPLVGWKQALQQQNAQSD